jgi:hypothetical protein
MALALFACALVVAACTGTDEAPREAPAGPIEIKVMEFNIEYGGEEVDFRSVVDAIVASGADIVGIEEAWGNMDRLGRALGWSYDERTHIVSRFPLLAPPDGDGRFTYVAVEPGRVVAIGNVHLPSSPYGPFRIRAGVRPRAILELERRVRIPAVRPFLTRLSELAERDVPSFLVGDFNAPSRLDWTPAAVGEREHVEFPLEWPVSVAVENAGFSDSCRDVHPDPVSDPGLTWPAKRPFVKGYNPGLNDSPADRIDFVYVAGPATTLTSQLVGERGAPGVDIAISPWPTDHRGVVSSFEAVPAVPPVLVTVAHRVVEQGDGARVLFHSPGRSGERVVVVPRGSGPAEAVVAERSTGDGAPRDGAITLATEGWDPRAYDVVLLSGSGEELARTSFWVLGPRTKPSIDTAGSVFAEGDPIEVVWRGAPGNRWDWVGVYKRGADPNVASYLLWVYTDASVAGSTVFDGDANGRPWPLPPGRYSVYLLEDDGYEKLAGAAFTVRGAGGG